MFGNVGTIDHELKTERNMPMAPQKEGSMTTLKDFLIPIRKLKFVSGLQNFLLAPLKTVPARSTEARACFDLLLSFFRHHDGTSVPLLIFALETCRPVISGHLQYHERTARIIKMTLYSSSSGIKRTRIGEVNKILTLGSIALAVAALVSFAASAIGKLGVVVAPLPDGQDEREKDVMTFDFAKDGKITEQPPHLTPIDPILSLQSEGFTTLDLAHREGKIHTGSWIFVVDNSDKLLLLRRGPELVTCPLSWSMVGEHAYRDENKKDTLKRGIEEELGDKT